MPQAEIRDVSDTALWVAAYRAEETDRPDALFHDPLAGKLIGQRGREIAARMTGSNYTSWSIVIRTMAIDALILEQVSRGIDTVINLGAGLDTRPYRLALPENLRWIEVDFPQIVELKEQQLKAEKPACKLERISLDLANRNIRRDFLGRISQESTKVLVITEGVVPYLTEAQVAELAEDLREQASIQFWLVDFFSPELYGRFRAGKRRRQMRNAPFQFFPKEMMQFYFEHGWKPKEIRYLVEEAEKVGRQFPFPVWARLLGLFMSEEKKAKFRKMMGYTLLEPR